MSRVRSASVIILLAICLIFAASVLPGLDWSDSHGLGVAWTQLSGLLAVLPMAIVVVLSARPRLLERPMGGLDKMYRLHKWLGIAAILFGILHWLTATGDGHRQGPGAGSGAGQAAPDVAAAAQPAADAATAAPALLQSLMGPAHALAQPALFALIALGLVALVRQIPYRWFARTHILTVPLFLFFIFHSVVLMKAGYWSLPVAWVAVALMAAGMLAAVYAILHYAGLTPATRAEVLSSTYFPEIRVLETTLSLQSVWPGHAAGQFAFVTTDRREGAHPFTIASDWTQAQPVIKFVAKELGDHTNRLRQEFTAGRPVWLEGPYGHFTFDDARPRQIWIGAGIGITPFIARMERLARRPDGRPVDLFHATAEESAGALARLRADAAASGTTAHIRVTSREGRLDFADISQAVPDWKEASVWFCGPALYGAALRRQFLAAGLSPRDWHQELFEMR